MKPVDYALGVIMPIHSHIALNYVRHPSAHSSCFFSPQPCRLPGLGAPRWAPPRQVVSDYVPMAARGAARAGVLGTTLVALAGLYKLNASGPGISKTVKQLWTK